MKRFLWLLLTLAVVVCAFLLPERWLISEQNRRANGSYTSDVSQDWEGSGANLTMGEKLTLLSKRESLNGRETLLEYDCGVISGGLQIRNRYYSELNALFSEQMISAEVYAMLRDGEIEISKVILLDMEQGESLSAYRVSYYDGVTHAIVDVQTGKLLCLTVSGYILNVLEAETVLLSENSIVGWNGWDDYYGGKIERDYFGIPDEDGIDFYLYALQFSLDGEEIGFTVHYSSVMDTITWGPDTPEIAAWLCSGGEAW